MGKLPVIDYRTPPRYRWPPYANRFGRAMLVLAAIFLVSIIVSVVLEQISLSRGRPAYAAMCESNLKGIGCSLLMYATEHRSFPTDLSALERFVGGYRRILICPKSADALLPDATLKAEPFAKRHSYSYVAGLLPKDPPTTIVAFERNDNHGADKVAHVTLEATVTRTTRADLNRKLQTQLGDFQARGRQVVVKP